MFPTKISLWHHQCLVRLTVVMCWPQALPQFEPHNAQLMAFFSGALSQLHKPLVAHSVTDSGISGHMISSSAIYCNTIATKIFIYYTLLVSSKLYDLPSVVLVLLWCLANNYPCPGRSTLCRDSPSFPTTSRWHTSNLFHLQLKRNEKKQQKHYVV